MKSNSSLLIRESVNKELEKILDYPISIINTPMGYGKTTAVKCFFDSLKIEYIWLSLPAPVESDEYFWNKLMEQIQPINADMASMLKVLGFPDDSIKITGVLDAITSTIEKNALFLIIDDYQYIETPLKNEFITRISLAQIPNFHIVLISRSIPKIPIVEMVAKDIAFMPDSAVFAFHKDDIREYFKLIGFYADEKMLTEIYSRTGGWITAVYLIASSIMKKLNFSIDYSIEQLLRSSIFDVYDNKMQILLCKLSIFNTFTIEQANFVTKENDIEKNINRLYLENAFITQESNGIFRFQRIFLEFLCKIRQEMDIDFNQLYLNAGEWYASINDYELSFQYFRRAKDYHAILSKLESPAVGRQAYEMDLKLVYSIFEEADDSLVYEYPIAALKYAFLLLTNADDGKGLRLINSLSNYFACNEHPKYSKDRLNAEIILISTYADFNDISKMIEHHKKAKELLHGERSLIRTSDDIILFGSPHFSYTYYKTKGGYKDIIQILSTQLTDYMQLTGGCSAGCDFLALAEYALETGDLADAELNAFKAIYKSKMYNQFDILMGAKFTLARIYSIQGKYEEGLELLDDLSSEIGNIKDTILHNEIELCFGYLYACHGEYDKIPDWIRAGTMKSVCFKHQGIAFEYIVYGKTEILKGNYLELEILTESYQEHFKAFNNQLGLIHNHIHSAIAKYNLYGLTEASIELNKAFEIGKADHILMPFVENAAYIMPIIKSGLIYLSGEYYGDIVSMCGSYSSSILKDKVPVSILTIRETEVLSYLSKGNSQKDIADKLFISQNTVRRHLQNIYIKLGADNKTIAVNKARELKII